MLRRFTFTKPLLRRYNLHSDTKALLEKIGSLETEIKQFKNTHVEQPSIKSADVTKEKVKVNEPKQDFFDRCLIFFVGTYTIFVVLFFFFSFIFPWFLFVDTSDIPRQENQRYVYSPKN